MAKEIVEQLNFSKDKTFKKRNASNSNEVENSTGFFSKLKMPDFLNKESISDEQQENLLALTHSQKDFNPNSIGSIFSKDRQEVAGINRVFRKSILFLIFQLVAFLALILISLNFFNNIALNLIILVVSVAVTNTFFIIVADRSYVWLSLLSQFLLIIIANSFLGLAFNPITLVLSFLIILFNYLAYSELEKVQLSSRLFSISHITAESSRILLTSGIILLSLGIFNSIIFEGTNTGKNLGSRPFLDRVVFSNKFITDTVLIGKSKSTSLNKFLIGGNLYKESDSNRIVYDESLKSGTTTKQATFGYFLAENYEFSNVLTTREESDFRQLSCSDVGSESKACSDRVQVEIDKKLEDWRVKNYSNLKMELNTPLTITNYRLVVKQFYLNKIADFESDKSDNNSFINSSLLVIPVTSVIPAIFAITVLLLGFIFRFLLSWITFAVNSIVWKLLVLIGFAQIDIETVEAEIVSI